MINLNQHPQASLAINLTALSICLVIQSYAYFSQSLSPLFVIVCLICVALIWHIFILFKRQNSQLATVIKALANGDSSLGLSLHHPMQHYFEDVKKQMQHAQLEAEHQALFLQAIMIQINLAVLVCDNNGKILISNPSVTKLLGKTAPNIAHYDSLGDIVLNAKKNLQCTVEWLNGGQQDTLSVRISVTEIQGDIQKIVSLQSIRNELNAKEQRAYKRLTKVLTHEVANSITPMASLAQTSQGLLPKDLSFKNQQHKDDLNLALNTIASRAHHLDEFINQFKQFNTLPKPNLSPERLSSIVENIRLLFQSQLDKQGISFNIVVLAEQLVMLDRAQIEQVLINLLNNAIDSLKEAHGVKSEITVTVAQNVDHQVFIELNDNGHGIAEHVADMIFVPFFTTKQQGSGIGLSLSRQIMMNHGGDLTYRSSKVGACFRCTFQ